MTLATPAQVAAICDVSTLIVGNDLSGLQAFINIADDMVNNLLTSSIYGYSTLTLTNIEIYLSAHFYTIRDKDSRAISETGGDASRTTGDKRDMGFEATEYGKAAMTIEHFGILEALNRRVKDGVAPKPGIVSLQSRRWWYGAGYGYGGYFGG